MDSSGLNRLNNSKLVSAWFILGVLACPIYAADELPDLKVEDVVNLYLGHVARLPALSSSYRVTRQKLGSEVQSLYRSGTFGIAGNRFAAKLEGLHASYDGMKTRYRLFDELGVIKAGAVGPFSEYWDTPVLMFDVVQSPELTPIRVILEDAIGLRRLGDVRLVVGNSEVQGRPCYVVEGSYDRVILTQAKISHPVPWRYRLFFDPAYDMAIVRKEFTDGAQNIELGIIEVTKLQEFEDAWVPMTAVFTSYAYEKSGNGLMAYPVMEHTLELIPSDVNLVDVETSALFNVEFPDSAVVRDEINDKVSQPSDSQPQPDRKGFRWIFVLNIAVFLGVLVWLIMRKPLRQKIVTGPAS